MWCRPRPRTADGSDRLGRQGPADPLLVELAAAFRSVERDRYRRLPIWGILPMPAPVGAHTVAASKSRALRIQRWLAAPASSPDDRRRLRTPRVGVGQGRV